MENEAELNMQNPFGPPLTIGVEGVNDADNIAHLTSGFDVIALRVGGFTAIDTTICAI